MAADMVYPALFGYTCFRLTGLLLAGTRLQAILKKRLLPLPVVSAVLDYLENCCLIAVVSACPEALQIAAAAPFFTVVKSAAAWARAAASGVPALCAAPASLVKNKSKFQG